MIPQLIVIALSLLNLGMTLERHGEPKKGTYNFGTDVIAFVISTLLLLWGGWYDCFLKP